MGMLIRELLDLNTFYALTSNFHPTMIQDEVVAQAAMKLVKTIKSLELYPRHKALIDQFEQLPPNDLSIHLHRTLFLWQMSQAGYQLTSLKLPHSDFLRSNYLKCEASFISVVLDDVCDLGRDKVIFENCKLALQGQVSDKGVGLYSLIANVWVGLQSEIVKAPNYQLLKALFEEAYQMWIDSFEYSLWLYQAPHLEEGWKRRLGIISHTSFLYFAGLVDLLFVPNLSLQEAHTASQVFLRAQQIVQAANWATTWPRELTQQDFTSGVFSMALEKGWVKWDDLKSGRLEKVADDIQNSPAENSIWNECERLRLESLQIVKEAKLSILDGYVESLSPILFLFLASKQEFSNYQR